MTLYQELIATVPPGLLADDVIVGACLAAVRSGQRCGIATVLLPERHGHKPLVSDPGTLRGRPLRDLADLCRSQLPVEAAIGMAAINAAIDHSLLDWRERNAADYIRDLAAGKNLVVVGHFPFIEQLAPHTHSTTVLEIDPREGDLPASAAERVIPAAHLVAITGSAFSNHTIENLLRLSAGRTIIILGPTTPLSPVLFHHGVTAIAGSIITNPDSTFRQIAEGGGFRQLTGVSRVMALK